MTGAQTWQNGNKGLKLGNYSPFAHVFVRRQHDVHPSVPIVKPCSFTPLNPAVGVTEEARSGGSWTVSGAQEGIYYLSSNLPCSIIWNSFVSCSFSFVSLFSSLPPHFPCWAMQLLHSGWDGNDTFWISFDLSNVCLIIWEMYRLVFFLKSDTWRSNLSAL